MAQGGSIALMGLAAVAALAIASRGRSGRGGKVAPGPRPGGGLGEVWDLAQLVEETGALPGFSAFATAAAYTESGGNNLIGRGVSQGILPGGVHLNHSESEAQAACNLWEGAVGRGWYQQNPYDWRYWCFGSGGWFAFLPATGLAAGGQQGPFATESPFLVFDPIPSVVMMADFAYRIMRGNRFQSLPWGEQNWAAVRRGMASSNLIGDYTESHDKSRRNRENFEEALAETGTSPDFAFTRAAEGDYPGAANLLAYLYERTGEVAA